MRTRTKRVLVIGGAVVVVGAVIVANLKQKSSGKGEEVRTEAVGQRRIEAWVRAPGKVQPVTKVQVSSNVMGRVAELAVREGERVKAGDLLLRLDDERYRSQVAAVSGSHPVGGGDLEARRSGEQGGEAEPGSRRSPRVPGPDLDPGARVGPDPA